MALVDVELDTLVSEPDALTTQPPLMQCLVACFPSLYKQDDIKSSRPLSTAISVQHLATYALDSS